jgi:spore coat polysaccharide biosynthesis protein SpsF
VKVLVVVQARTGSSRLPGKVLLSLAGRPVLERLIERIRAAKSRFDICVATTPALEDEPIRLLARRLAVRVFSGHPTDLLDRHYRAGLSAGADVVVKIPSDCPLIDPDVIDRVLGAFECQAGGVDFVTNLNPPSWPDGNDVEVIPMDVLAIARSEARSSFEREHTTPFIWRRPERFRITNVRWDSALDLSATHRFTLDYADDYALIRALYEALYRSDRPIFSLDEILTYLSQHPEVHRLNQRFWGQTYVSAAAHSESPPGGLLVKENPC